MKTALTQRNTRECPHDKLANAISAPSAAIIVGTSINPPSPAAAAGSAGGVGASRSHPIAQPSQTANATIDRLITIVATPRLTRSPWSLPLRAPPQASTSEESSSTPATIVIQNAKGAAASAPRQSATRSATPAPLASMSASAASIVSTNEKTAARCVRSAASAVRVRCQNPAEPSSGGRGGESAGVS